MYKLSFEHKKTSGINDQKLFGAETAQSCRGNRQHYVGVCYVYKNGEKPNSAETQEFVKKLQNHIAENYYLCTKILLGLGQIYIEDERLKTY